MIRKGDVIENPVTGERLLFLETSAETNGEYVLVECTVQPNGFVAAAHVHPKQTERFEIESGTVAVDVGELPIDELNRYVERTFRPVAESRKLDFLIRLDPHLPPSMFTDSKRLQQIINNLLSNAFKFTERGGVTLNVGVASEGWNSENDMLNRAATVVAFSVRARCIRARWPSWSQPIVGTRPTGRGAEASAARSS